MEWDEYFILEAYAAALKSKDPRTQVGACIVGPDKEIRSKGYNGPCRGEMDDDPAIFEKPLKDLLFEHAERNAFYNLARIGVSGKGCTLYCVLHPCVDCARGSVQVGIREVVLHEEYPEARILNESQQHAARLFERLGIPVRWWSGIPPILGVRNNGVYHRFHCSGD